MILTATHGGVVNVQSTTTAVEPSEKAPRDRSQARRGTLGAGQEEGLERDGCDAADRHDKANS